MSGICGWLGYPSGDQSVLAAMRRRFVGCQGGEARISSGASWALAACGSPGTFAVVGNGRLHVAAHGHPGFVREGRSAPPIDEFCGRALSLYRELGERFVEAIGGDFTLAVVDEERSELVLATDRIGVRSVVYQHLGEALVFGATSDIVSAHPLARRTIDEQSIYDYVYFHMVPGPATMFREQRKLPAAHALRFSGGRASAKEYWKPTFEEGRDVEFESLKLRFRDALRTGVSAFTTADTGAFLSGGTDSSTITGVLGSVTGSAPRTYSIGFAERGYDELEYARIAARHFHADAHEHCVTPQEVVDAVPLIAGAYDQPFGNASAVPTYLCALSARNDGIQRLLGGDGGDELFGGNERYSKQQQLEYWRHVPAPLRAGLENVLLNTSAAARLPVLKKARSYVLQARTPMPARYESYNLLKRLGPKSVFEPDFLTRVSVQEPLRQLEHLYQGASASSLINRMLALDIKFTLADNDLPKVTRMCDLAGVDVAFPMLHESVVDFSLGLVPSMKLKGTRLRYFFKEALRDFLPAEIISKKKHGFGLPAGVWLRDFGPLHEAGRDAIARLRQRGIFRPSLLDELMGQRLQEHAGYYGTLAWVLMMLELWYERHV